MIVVKSCLQIEQWGRCSLTAVACRDALCYTCAISCSSVATPEPTQQQVCNDGQSEHLKGVPKQADPNTSGPQSSFKRSVWLREDCETVRTIMVNALI